MDEYDVVNVVLDNNCFFKFFLGISLFVFFLVSFFYLSICFEIFYEGFNFSIEEEEFFDFMNWF